MDSIPPFRQHRYRSACGRLDLYARDYAGDGSADRPALLLMHGLTRNSADFEPLAEHLAGPYRLVVPDQRGRGLSDWDSDPANYRPDLYAADMFALLDSLGIARVGLIGTSMGGLMAMLMAATSPGRVPGVVLNDIGPQVEAAGIARIQGYVGPAGACASWQDAADRCAAINGEALPDLSADDWLAFARRTCARQADGSIAFAYDPAIAGGFAENAGAEAPQVVPPDLWPLWDMLAAVPVLVIRGAISDLFAAATVREMARRHSGPFEAVEIANRGHAPMLDEPGAVTAIKAFLSRHIG